MSANTQSDVQGQCREMVLASAREITQALIDKAIEGSHQHAKFLFDFAFGAAKANEDDDDIPGPSLADILLQRLRELEQRTEAEDCARA